MHNLSGTRNAKLRGEWAEMRFMTRAAEHGLMVSKPWGDSAPYDFMIERHGRVLRIQVKCTSCKRDNCYKCHVASNGVPYPKDRLDFIAAYVIPADTWYIIPIAAVGAQAHLLLAPTAKAPSTTATKKPGTCCYEKSPGDEALILQSPEGAKYYNPGRKPWVRRREKQSPVGTTDGPSEAEGDLAFRGVQSRQLVPHPEPARWKLVGSTGASPATASRHLADLTDKGGLVREGERRHARYKLSVPLRPAAHVTINLRGKTVEA